MPIWNEAVFWPTFKAVGFLSKARVLVEGSSEPVCVDVDYHKPDFDMVTGMRSREYTMEYQTDDLPTLGEGDQVEIEETNGTVSMFVVREEPAVMPPNPTGFFSKAILTKVG